MIKGDKEIIAILYNKIEFKILTKHTLFRIEIKATASLWVAVLRGRPSTQMIWSPATIPWASAIEPSLDAIQDLFCKFGMKPHVHLVEISIFSLNHVIIRLTKIMNNFLKHLKIRTFKVFFCVKNCSNLSEKKNLWRIFD